MRVEVWQVIDRPVADVFRFYAHDHVRNHPRWDPDMELEQLTDGPIGVGTIIRRRNRHSGVPVDGTMEVVEFDLDRAIGVVIREGAVATNGRATFEAQTESRTILTISVEIPGMDESMDTTVLTGLIARSLRNIKQLAESEL